MKKAALSLLILTALTFFASCKKNYTCECFTSGNTYPIEDASRAEADAKCETYENDPFNGNCAIQ